MATPIPRLIYCADGNPSFASVAVECGWLYGARLPSTVYQQVYFADQDWKKPNRALYMKALAEHMPAMATVLDWEHDGQLDEVMSWAEEAAHYVTEAVLIVPKVVGGIPQLPETIGGKKVILAYSVPTKYGGCPLPIWEFAGKDVHLLGGSPQEQMRLWRIFRTQCDVVSVDGNMAHQQAHKCRFWQNPPGPKGFWTQLKESGDHRTTGANIECFRKSLVNIRQSWQNKSS